MDDGHTCLDLWALRRLRFVENGQLIVKRIRWMMIMMMMIFMQMLNLDIISSNFFFFSFASVFSFNT